MYCLSMSACVVLQQGLFLGVYDHFFLYQGSFNTVFLLNDQSSYVLDGSAAEIKEPAAVDDGASRCSLSFSTEWWSPRWAPSMTCSAPCPNSADSLQRMWVFYTSLRYILYYIWTWSCFAVKVVQCLCTILCISSVSNLKSSNCSLLIDGDGRRLQS